MAARSAASLMTSSSTAPERELPMTRKRARIRREQRGERVDDLADRLHDAQIAVPSTLGGMSTVAIRRLTAPLRMAMAMAPTAFRRSFWIASGHVGGDRLGEHQARGVGHGHAVDQPVDAEICDRGDVDQHFADA